MRTRHLKTSKLLCGVAMCAMAINAIAPIAAAQEAAGESGSNDANTTTPIKHVIVIIGENRTFDHVFATYVPTHKTRYRAQPVVGGHRQRRRHAGTEL